MTPTSSRVGPLRLPLVIAFGQLFVRNRIQLFFSLIFPFFFMAMFVFIGLLMTPDATVSVVGSDSDLQAQVGQAGFNVESARSAEEAIDSLRSGQILAVVDAVNNHIYIAESSDQVDLEQLAAREGMVATVVPGSEILDPVRFGLPGVLTFATLNVAFFGTATPLLEMRKSGILNALRRTPARTLDIVLGPVPSRVATFGIVLLITIGLAVTLGFLPVGALPKSVAVGLVCFAASTTWAYLLGARGRSVEMASGISGMVLPVLLMLSGAMLPLEILPDVMQKIAFFVPISHIASLYRNALTDVAPTWPVWQSYLILAASALVAMTFTVRMFRWR